MRFAWHALFIVISPLLLAVLIIGPLCRVIANAMDRIWNATYEPIMRRRYPD